MNRTIFGRTLYGSTVALALFCILVLPADADAIGLYSVIARAAAADIRLVVLIPEENAYPESACMNHRIRFTCDINYRLTGNATWGNITRRGLIVTDEFIGLVTVRGNTIREDSTAETAGKDEPHPLTALRRIVDKKVKRHVVTSVCCLKTIAAAAWHLIAGYVL